MAEIKYEMRKGLGKGSEIPVAADQYVSRLGGKFVYLDAGNVTMCASDSTKVYGWALPPKDAAGYNSWKSSSTAEADKIFVITELDAEFEMPYTAGDTLAASLVGEDCSIVDTGTTYTTIQVAKAGNTGLAASLLVITGVDVDNSTVLVKIKPAYKQVA